MKFKYRIKGLDCANCADRLERVIKKVKGVEKVSISFMSERLELEFDEKNKEEIIKEIQKVVKKEEPDCTIKEW